MGCDGGTIPKRDELVKKKKKPEQKDKEAELRFRWQHCAISQQPLRQPIVACGLGRLYCKETVLEGLLDRSKLPETASHITSLKDVKELRLTPNPAFVAPQNGQHGDGYVDYRTAPYICPVIGIEMSGKFGFSFPWNCGCAISEKAFKEVPAKLCHKCQQPFVSENLVVLNAEGEALELMKSRMEARKVAAKAAKKSKKQNRTAVSSSDVNGEGIGNSSQESPVEMKTLAGPLEPEMAPPKPVEVPCIKVEPEEMPKISKVENKPAAVVAVPEEKSIKREESSRKRSRSPERRRRRSGERSSDKRRDDKSRHRHYDRRSERDRDHKKHSSSRDSHRHPDRKSFKVAATEDPAYKKAKSEYSVANDPRASSVYKSLFTSHETAKSQTKAHWITYNPFYN